MNINDDNIKKLNKGSSLGSLIDCNKGKENFIINNAKNDNILKQKILKNAKYGIDENGNPVNILEYYKKINTADIKKPRLIAYIKEDNGNNKNELFDLNGNKIENKNKEGDFEFPFALNILIKNFDVQHPELRIHGERKYKDNIDFKDNQINNSSKKKEEICLPIDSSRASDINFQMNNTDNEIIKYEKELFKLKYKKGQDKFMKIMEYKYGGNRSCRYINFESETNKHKILKLKDVKNHFITRTNRILYTNFNKNLSYKNKNKSNRLIIRNIINKENISTNKDYYAINNVSSSKDLTNFFQDNSNISSHTLLDYSFSLDSNYNTKDTINLKNAKNNNSGKDINKNKNIFYKKENNLLKINNDIVNKKIFNKYFENSKIDISKNELNFKKNKSKIFSTKIFSFLNNNDLLENGKKEKKVIKAKSRVLNKSKLLKKNICSILTEEANNMIKNFSSKKMIIKQRNKANVNKENINNRYISTPIIKNRKQNKNISFD